MIAERTLNLELVMLIVIQHLCRGGRGVADDRFVKLVVKMVYGKMSIMTNELSSLTIYLSLMIDELL